MLRSEGIARGAPPGRQRAHLASEMKKLAKSSQVKPATETVRPEPALDSKGQNALFTKAMKHFTSGDFRKAKEGFDQAAAGPHLPMSESAKMYSRMCEQRLNREKPELRTPEDHYNYAVSLINLRRLQDARAHLETAVAESSEPHFLYALSLVEGLLGSVDSAAARLRQAIEKDPGLRAVVKNDADYAPLLHHPQLLQVIAGEPAPAA